MPVVKINAIHVPEGSGTELERRFAARKHSVDNQPGFLGFQLLRPVSGESRYFVVTTWESDEAFEAWRANGAAAAHGGGQHGSGDGQAERLHGQADSTQSSEGPRPPVATGADLLEFEVVDLD